LRYPKLAGTLTSVLDSPILISWKMSGELMKYQLSVVYGVSIWLQMEFNIRLMRESRELIESNIGLQKEVGGLMVVQYWTLAGEW